MASVQAISSSLTTASISNIPSEFVRPVQEQPGLTTHKGHALREMPFIDLAGLDEENTVQAIATASRDWGIFQLLNHGIPEKVIEELQHVGKEFFDLPQDEKEKYSVAAASSAGIVEGYGSKFQKDLEGKKTWVDFLSHNLWPLESVNYDFWPKYPDSYRKASDEYAKHLVKLLDKVLLLLSKGLELEGNALKEALGGGKDLELRLKINYYPPCPCPDLTLGLVAHCDISAITFLTSNDVPGLQVFKDDQWWNTRCIPNAIIVNIGDQIQVLSNGRYKSVLHRTIVSGDKLRMSWPVFCAPPSEMVIGPLPLFVTDDYPAKYKQKKYKEYYYRMINNLPQ